MANNLDNKKIYEKLDTHEVANSISFLSEQINQLLDEATKIKIPRKYSHINKVVINGMGGSNIGARIAKSVFSDKADVPILIEPGYEVPKYIDKKTLYIISSYSGTTEEPISTYEEAKKRGAKIMAITSDNPETKLSYIIKGDDVPNIIFEPSNNPSGQPRLGVGYSVFGISILLAKSGVFEIDVTNIKNTISFLRNEDQFLNPEKLSKENIAKQIANKINGKSPIIVGAEFLNGNVHAMRNQINESSKNFATYLTLPDLNHFAMEGLSYPSSLTKNICFLFFDSDLYSTRVQKRSQLTKEVVEQNKIEAINHQLKGENKLIQSFELLQLGCWISYYLGILNNIDPVAIPWVDWFKEQLK